MRGISDGLTFDLKLYFLKIDEIRIFSSISANLKYRDFMKIAMLDNLYFCPIQFRGPAEKGT